MGPFEEEEEGTSIASDVVKVQGEDPDTPDYPRGDRVRLGRRRSRIVGASPIDLTCKRVSVGQSEGLLIPRSSIRFRLKPEKSNSYGFELHTRPSIKGTKLLLKVIEAIVIMKGGQGEVGTSAISDRGCV